ncbi:MAG: dimethylarginine dimethylaminohydrolase family protein [Acidobacteriota bacterium]
MASAGYSAPGREERVVVSRSARQKTSAYGGPGWSPRLLSMGEEIGSVWASCGLDSEWSSLRSVLLHRPGEELAASADPSACQMLASLEIERARRQHDGLAGAFRNLGVDVHLVSPAGPVPPNLMFVADLLLMTPEGAIVGRPASTVRAGEERHVARRLADLGIPILRCVSGRGTFEGADGAWVEQDRVLLGRGLRSNTEGLAQVRSTLAEMGVEARIVDLPAGTMHLMGQLRIVDRDLAIVWSDGVPYAALDILRESGYRVLFLPEEAEAEAVSGMSLNFVVVAPRRVLMPAGNPQTERFYESAGTRCETVEVDELLKAAGGIGCLTGVLHREPTPG